MKTIDNNEMLVLGNFQEQFKNVRTSYERRAERLKEKMNEDFEHFFRWNAEELYEITLILDKFKGIQGILEWNDLGRIKEALQNLIKNIEIDLIEGSAYGRSSSPMHNMAETFSKVAKQELRGELQKLLWIVE